MKLFFRKRKRPKMKQTNARRHGTTTNPNAVQQQPLSRDEKRKLERLQRDGIIILIDHANLEVGFKKVMKRKYGKHEKYGSSSDLSYGFLVDIIARSGERSEERRKVLGTYLVSSKQYQVRGCHRPSKKYLKRNRITLKRSPYRRKSSKEKATDETLVRIMTQEFEGIEILRLMGMTPPKRTFCIVAGDYDYIDVAQQARDSGCDVEIWYWRNNKQMNQAWFKSSDDFMIEDLEPFVEDLARDRRDNSEAWSEYPYESDESDSSGWESVARKCKKHRPRPSRS